MNKTSSKERLEHVKTAILYIQLFVKDQTVDDFLQDIKGQNAALYQFLVIGEAIKNVDNAILQKYQYPWHIPKSFRNFIAHEYHKIKMQSVYNAANDLDELLKIVETMLQNEF